MTEVSIRRFSWW